MNRHQPASSGTSPMSAAIIRSHLPILSMGVGLFVFAVVLNLVAWLAS